MRFAANSELLENWNTYRAKAEVGRRKFFDLMSEPPEAASPDKARLEQQLDFFTVFQLCGQLDYYLDAKEKLKTRHVNAKNIIAVVLFLIGVVYAIVSASTDRTALLALVIAGQAVVAMLNSRNEMEQGETNAKRYEMTADKLNELYARYPAVQTSVLNGTPEMIRDYVASVHEVMNSEHKEWLGEVRELQSRVVADLFQKLEENAPQNDGHPGQNP
jgi:hypothetical protein